MKDRIQRIPAFIRERTARLMRSFTARWRKLAFAFSWIVGLLVLGAFAGMEVTSKPGFCGSCHIMEPYYDSWKHSSHGNIACVDCHIPPGVASGLRKKYEALSMVTSYFTGTYGTKPWAEVPDASCLQCHERSLLTGKKPFQNVLFDHAPHLTESRKGKKLRCTSCHSQTVQGSHIAISTSTCFLCHFKEQKFNAGTGRCTLCHEVPEKVITKTNLSFNHADVKRFNMQCSSCHSQVVQGQGEVPRGRCNTCHNDLEKLQQYDETELLHQKHVSEHKIECVDCHTEIQHKAAAPSMEMTAGSCSNCHRDGHSAARDLYAGTGGKGVSPMPSAMYEAGISCEGCHFLPPEKGMSPVMKANEASCMSCHGTRYNKMLDRWKNLVDQRLAQIKQELAEARRQLAKGDALSSDHHEAGPFADAWSNVQLVEQGVGAHNVEYSLKLIDASHELINQAREQSGLKPLAKRWQEPPFESKCFRCHRGIEVQTGRFFNMRFLHKPHVASGFECATCHRPHEERTSEEVVRFGREGCANCHHARQQQNPNSCLRCHSDLLKRKVRYKTKEFDHSLHFSDFSLKCADCHLSRGAINRAPNLNACSTCHPDGFQSFSFRFDKYRRSDYESSNR